MVGQSGDIINKARLFDNDFKKANGEANVTKIIPVMEKFDTDMMKTLGLMRKLLEP